MAMAIVIDFPSTAHSATGRGPSIDHGRDIDGTWIFHDASFSMYRYPCRRTLPYLTCPPAPAPMRRSTRWPVPSTSLRPPSTSLDLSAQTACTPTHANGSTASPPRPSRSSIACRTTLHQTAPIPYSSHTHPIPVSCPSHTRPIPVPHPSRTAAALHPLN